MTGFGPLRLYLNEEDIEKILKGEKLVIKSPLWGEWVVLTKEAHEKVDKPIPKV